MRKLSTTLGSALSAGTLALAVSLTGGTAHAAGIIKNPGDHPDYSVELEPHALLAWGGPWWNGSDAGFGLGMHAVIPFLKNGPIDSINNNMGIGFGLDWAHNSNNGCGWYYRGGGWANCGWSANTLMFPVYVQWNFFFTDVISVFGEGGLGIAHSWATFDNCPIGFNCTNSGTDVYPLFEGGGRFLFGKTVGLTVRVGYPLFTVGASFLL